jgi:S1-C subfamily serine protease
MVKNLLLVLENPKKRRHKENFLGKALLSGMFVVAFIFCSPSCGDEEVATPKRLDDRSKEIQENAEENDVESLVKSMASSVVLIHTFGPRDADDHRIYNSSVRKRKDYRYHHGVTSGAFIKGDHYYHGVTSGAFIKEYHYYHGVTSGVLISKDGFICTTAGGVEDSLRIIVSVNSEFRPLASGSSLILTKHDYPARIIRLIPELNLAFLKIDKKGEEEFDYLALGNDGALTNGGVLRDSAVVVGKCMGENYVTVDRPCNSSSNFGVSAAPVLLVYYKKVKGAPFLELVNSGGGCCVMPENEGGAIINTINKKLIGIAFVNHGDFSIRKSAGIPISTIKQGIMIAAPHMIYNEANINLGMKVKDAKNIKVDQKSLNAIKVNKKLEKIGVEVVGLEMESAAMNSGVQVGDIILKFDDEIVDDSATFANLEKHSIGKQVVILTILRKEKVLSIEIDR